MKKFLTTLLASAFIFLAAAPTVAVFTPQNAAAAGPPKCDNSILGIPPWYRGLTDPADCSKLKTPTNADETTQFILRLVLNGLQIALVLTAYLSGFMIIYGGFLLLTNGYKPEMVERGRKTILSAIFGLAIALSAVAVVNFIFAAIGSSPTVVGGVPAITGAELLKRGLNLIYFLAGTLAVIVIVVAGMRFSVASGNPTLVTKARNLLTYAIVGLIVILVAFVATNFVIERFS